MCLSHSIYSAAVSDSHLLCRAHAIPDHATLLKATAQHVRRERATCSRSASSGYDAGLHEVLISRVPISDAGGQCKTKHRLSWTRKRVVVAHYKKRRSVTPWTSSSDISGYHTYIHEGHGTVGEGQGRAAAWHV
jgi:hypothetical protein